jgi:hypothetical protein
MPYPFYSSFNEATHSCDGDSCRKKDEQWRNPCVLSETFSSAMEIFMICPKTKQLKLFGMGWAYLDYRNHRVRFDLMGTKQDKKVQYSAWAFFDDHKVYFTDRTTTDHKCVGKALKGSMKKPMIPNNSTFITLLQRGTEVVEMWKLPFTKHTEDQMTEQKKNKILLMEVTEGTCIPVEAGLLVKDKSEDDMAMTPHRHISAIKPVVKIMYMNWVNDVPPYIFEMPSECTEKAMSKEEMKVEEENFPYQMMDMMITFGGLKLDKME